MAASHNAIKSGDSKAADEMMRSQEARRKIPNMDFIGNISENFSNGIIPVKLYIDGLLKK